MDTPTSVGASLFSHLGIEPIQDQPETISGAEIMARIKAALTNYGDDLEHLLQLRNDLGSPDEWNELLSQARKEWRESGNSNKETFSPRETEPEPKEKVSILDGFNRSILTADTLATLPVQERTKIVGDWFRTGDLGYIYASRGVGKTYFGLEMAGSITKGANFGPWEVTTKSRVLYIDGEVALDDTKKRNFALSLAGANSNLIYLHHEHLFNICGLTIDIADKEHQEAVLSLCLDGKVDVAILDNLSCLATAVDENDGQAWSEQMLNWVLKLRRNGISTVFIQHAGRNGEMRGHSRREDPASWIIKLDKVDAPEIGARFKSTFTKNRNCPRTPAMLEWAFTPHNDRTLVTFVEMGLLEQFRRAILDGVNTNKELAELLDVPPSKISKLATQATNEGWLTKNRTKFEIKKGSEEFWN